MLDKLPWFPFDMCPPQRGELCVCAGAIAHPTLERSQRCFFVAQFEPTSEAPGRFVLSAPDARVLYVDRWLPISTRPPVAAIQPPAVAGSTPVDRQEIEK